MPGEALCIRRAAHLLASCGRKARTRGSHPLTAEAWGRLGRQGREATASRFGWAACSLPIGPAVNHRDPLLGLRSLSPCPDQQGGQCI